jgi:hypothetical protein
VTGGLRAGQGCGDAERGGQRRRHDIARRHVGTAWLAGAGGRMLAGGGAADANWWSPRTRVDAARAVIGGGIFLPTCQRWMTYQK